MPIAPLALTLPNVQTPGASKGPTGDSSFGSILQKALESTIGDQKNAAALTQAAANGENVPVNQVVEAISRAELTLQTLISVRDKAVEAYQQIQQMPI